MSAPQNSDMGAGVLDQASVFPQTTSGTTPILGAAVDRFVSTAGQGGGARANSCIISARTGASTGSPSAQAHTAQLQHCATSGGSYVNVPTDENGNTGLVTLTADNQNKQAKYDLAACNEFLKVLLTPVWTGGSSPATQVEADICLGGFDGSQAGAVQ